MLLWPCIRGSREHASVAKAWFPVAVYGKSKGYGGVCVCVLVHKANTTITHDHASSILTQTVLTFGANAPSWRCLDLGIADLWISFG